ncbi:substrate-binding domain-containing protein [uncultured Bacteroides sp.]|uniref:LacI family DNA-binding transcriptional regulator n=1 Tax=uncultured Bacteroides sp. TaxID=162156 RepID=UPI0025E54FA7|nr:substrate-binding domain-containing protein [uncultured Bacteroides sp.]
MENKNYTIKDIARMAGVSAGTVDRVLHNRGDVSASSREKVQKVLDEIDYHPNMFAIGLAAKKRYCILCIIPYYIEYDYWHSVSEGINRAAQEMRPFNVSIEFLYYHHADRLSYEKACAKIRREPVDAVLIAPNFREETMALTSYLEGKGIPYAFIDFNIEDTHALCYIGQDSKASGYIAAKILMRKYEEGQELILFLNNKKNSPAEIQMQRRMDGFMSFIAQEHSNLVVHDVVLNKEDDAANRRTLKEFFTAHPQAVLGAVFNSRVYQVANYLQETDHHLAGLVGYDLLQKNVEYLKSGEVNYLIGQRPGLQGYCGIKALCDHMVFKRPVTAVKYMPIDILMKENINFYFEFE